MKFCPNCGKEILEAGKYCGSCGEILTKKTLEDIPNHLGNVPSEVVTEKTPIATTNETKEHLQAFQQLPANMPLLSRKKKSKTPLFIGLGAVGTTIVIAIVIIVILVQNAGSQGPDFKMIYGEYCKSIWADVGDDGSYLKIDTNPFDEEDNGVAFFDADMAIEEINKELGLPDSLYSDMNETTWSMGKQTEIFEDAGVIVSWTYHPDKGLEVTYKKSN